MIPANDNPIHARSTRRPGSAMILVVVLTVLLSLIGLMFILASRIEQATSLSANVDRDLSAGVDSVVDRVSKVLVDDLFSANRKAGLCDGIGETLDLYGITLVYNEPYDAVGKDPWMMSINPGWQEDPPALPDDLRDDKCDWFNLSDLYFDVWAISGFNGLGLMLPAMTVGPNLYVPLNEPSAGMPQIFSNIGLPKADADGDGVWDSVWVKLPNISSAKGQPLYSAVRIIDNCAMLNLNTAFKLDTNPSLSDGQYLSAVDYERFRRGRDRDRSTPFDPVKDALLADQIRKARMVDLSATLDTVQDYHDELIMNIDKPDPARYRLFDLADELEIRNRLLLTSSFEARFERPEIANFSLDSGGGLYAVLEVPRTDKYDDPFTFGGKTYTRTDFDAWKIRMNSANFDDKSGAYFDPSEYPNITDEEKRKLDFRWKYDRRHVCTFYSFDRNIRSGQDLVLDKVVGDLRDAYLLETNQTQKSNNLTILNTVRTVFWPANGSAASTRDLAIANTPESRKAIVHLLYALRAYYLRYDNPTLTVAQINADLDNPATQTPFDGPKALLSKAARKAAQTVANMIDYLDDTNAATPGPFFNRGQLNPDPTFIDETLVAQLVLDAYKAIDPINPFNPTDALYAFGLGSHVIYGYERQPFISELYCTFSASGIGRFAVEFVNPYDQDIRLEGWRIIVGDPKKTPRTFTFAASNCTVPKGTTTALGRFVLRNSPWGTLPNNTPTCEWNQLAGGSNGFATNDVILLQRPIPDGKGGRTWLTVDGTHPSQVSQLIHDGANTIKRDDRAWKFAQAEEVEIVQETATETLGRPNNVTIPGVKKSYQMPIADDNTATVSKPLATLGDFNKILTIGSEWITAADPNAITHFMSLDSDDADLAFDEDDVRTDIVSAPEILKYVGFLNRPAGNLPGRININTASKEVIRAAIPPRTDFVKTGEDAQKFADDLAGAIARTGQADAFKSIADLVTPGGKFANIVSLVAKWKNDTADNVGDSSMTDDIEERDWILSRLSNIFTVRSDTFTAYIAIRIGAPRVVSDTDPARRVVDVDADRRYIAIFDRSAVDQPDEAPRLVALHPVPDAR